MDRRTKEWRNAAVAGVMLGMAHSAGAAQGYFGFSTGAEFTTGEYGGEGAIDDWYIPFTFDYIKDSLILSLTIPHVRYSVPADEVVLAEPKGGFVLVTTEDREEEAGLGDVTAEINYYDAFDILASRGYAIDLAGEIKFGTADPDRGLGTGKNDYSVEASLFKPVAAYDLLGTVGYRFRGEPRDLELRDTWYGTLDAAYRLSNRFTVGVAYDYRQSPFFRHDPGSELTLYFNDAPTRDRSGTVYLIHGLTDSSPEWGIGLTLSFDFIPRTPRRVER